MMLVPPALGCSQSQANATNADPKIGTSIGDIAPAITATKMDGTKTTLKDYAGKTVVLNMWATWCGPCRNELPVIQNAYEQYQEKGVEFLGVNMQESKSAVEQFVTERKLTFPVLLDSDGTVSKALRISAVPTTYFIDGDGIIRAKLVGEMNSDTISKGINLALKAGK
jgi:peroxiredoxin